MSIVTEKQCRHCGEIKPVSDFSKTNKNRDGYKSWCKACCSLYQRAYEKPYISKPRKPRTRKFYLTCVDCGKPKTTYSQQYNPRCRNCATSRPIVEGTRQCSMCGKMKPLGEYFKHKLGKDGLNPTCKDCVNAQRRNRYHKDPSISAKARKWFHENPDKASRYQKKYTSKNRGKLLLKQKRADLRRYFGITLEEYNAMLEKQGGRCAICGGVDNGKRLSVDHDHATGKIRGLLCSSCNLGIGWLKEDISILYKAVEYLRYWEDDNNGK